MADQIPTSQVFVATESDRKRISAAVKLVESMPPEQGRTRLRARVPAVPWPVLGKITSGDTVAGDTNVTVRIYNGTAGSEADSGQDITNVVNKFGSASNGTWVWCMTNGINWYLVMGGGGGGGSFTNCPAKVGDSDIVSTLSEMTVDTSGRYGNLVVDFETSCIGYIPFTEDCCPE